MCNGDAGGQNAEPFRECIGNRGTHLRGPVDFRAGCCPDLQMGRISFAKTPTPPEGDAEEAKEPELGCKTGLRTDQEMLWKMR